MMSFDERRRADETAARARGLLVALALVGPLAGSGCISFGGRAPVPEEVATCHLLSRHGITAIERGDWQRAESLLSRAITACPTNVEARRHYGEALLQGGKPREAAAQFEAALRLAGNDAALAVRTGEAYLAMGDLERAEQRANRAIQLDARLAAAWALRGRVKRARGKSDEALSDLQRALGYTPNDARLLLEMAELYRSRGQPQRALATLQYLNDLYPPGEEPQNVLYLLGLAYKALGRHEDAVESLYAASVRGQPTTEILYHLGEAEYLAGRGEAAEANLRQALAIDPAHRPSLALVQQIRTAGRLGGMRR